MDYTVHGILQARIPEWVGIPFSRRSSQPRDWTQVSHIAGGFFTSWATREALPENMAPNVLKSATVTVSVLPNKSMFLSLLGYNPVFIHSSFHLWHMNRGWFMTWTQKTVGWKYWKFRGQAISFVSGILKKIICTAMLNFWLTKIQKFEISRSVNI